MFIHHILPKERIHSSSYSFDVGTPGNVLKGCFYLYAGRLIAIPIYWNFYLLQPL